MFKKSLPLLVLAPALRPRFRFRRHGIEIPGGE